MNVNIRDGLAEDLQLIWGPFVYKQVLDYENVPFRCRRCHAYGHPASECKQPIRIGMVSSHQQTSEKVVAEKEIGEWIEAAHVENMPIQDCTPLEVASEAVETTVPTENNQLVLSKVAGDAPSSSRLPETGITPLALSPSFNLFLNNVSIEGSD